MIKKLRAYHRSALRETFIAIIGLYVLTLPACNNYGFVEKLQNAGAGSGTKLYAFVSSITSLTGDISATLTFSGCAMSGMARADCACTGMAQTAGLKMPPSGKYAAWMSDSTDAARCRILGSTGSSCALGGTRAWYNVKDQMIATDIHGLISGSLQNPISFTENGTQTIATRVYTGTGSAGTQNTNGGANSCNNWATSGLAGLGIPTSPTQWTDDATPVGCGTSYPFYCFAVP